MGERTPKGEIVNKSNGIGIGTLLFCIFLVLKLTKTIDWSWWWVTAPLWIPLTFVATIFLAAAIMSTKGRTS